MGRKILLTSLEGELSNEMEGCCVLALGLFIQCAWRHPSAESATLAVLASHGPLCNLWVCAVGAGARPTLLVHGVHLASLYATLVALAQVRINTRRIPTHRFPESLLIPLSLSCPRCAGY